VDQHFEQRRKFARGHGAAIAAGLAAVAVIVLAVIVFRNSDNEPIRKVPQVTMVTLQPPPPPPPPPPPQQQPQPKMIEQPTIKEPEVKQEKPVEKLKEAPPKPVEAPPTGPLGLDAKAEGPGDAFNLAGNPGGNGLLGGGGGSRWGWYASMVQTQIEEALRDNKKTRNSSAALEVRLWSDAEGRVTRVQLVNSTGNPSVDDAIKNEVLAGLKLRQPPPSDMPMPIVARITERRPS
jgi:periplasmic protein TonB